MENLDVMVLRTLRDWRLAGKRALLATVVRTWGSSPRPVGSIMALNEDGAVVGSVSGGCIEDDLIYRYTAAYASKGAAPDAGASHTLPSGPPSLRLSTTTNRSALPTTVRATSKSSIVRHEARIVFTSVLKLVSSG